MRLSGSGTFNNFGTFLNTGGAATTANVTFNNEGLVDVQGGTIEQISRLLNLLQVQNHQLS